MLANSKAEMTIGEFKTDFPTHHSLKLCMLGKAYSGKKTQA